MSLIIIMEWFVLCIYISCRDFYYSFSMYISDNYIFVWYVCISYLMEFLCLWPIYHECPEGTSWYIGQ